MLRVAVDVRRSRCVTVTLRVAANVTCERGRLAQLGERLPYKQEVTGSIPVPPTQVVVEGLSDQAALEALAERRGIDLEAAGIRIVRLGGAHRIGRFLEELGPLDDVRLVGMCDAGEQAVFRRALEHAGLGHDLDELGFYVCEADLEDELIRALGAAAVEEILRTNGDLHRFRTLQQMPAWRGRATEEQLRRFMHSGGRRKFRYARILIEALDLERVPRPLDGVLTRASEGTPPGLRAVRR
jgi:hypothetical protein